MWFEVVRDLVFSVTILVLLFGTPCSSTFVKNENKMKSAVFLSPKFELGPGSVINRYYYGIDFPKGHIALKSFNAEVVDEAGNSIPLHETYIHHWTVERYHQRKHMHTENDGSKRPKTADHVLFKNSGICQGDAIPQYYGMGSETRGMRTDIPDPFGIVVGNPEDVPEGFEEIWMLNIHAIDTRGVEDKQGCTECRTELYNVTIYGFGNAIPSDYKGGASCCYDNTQCKLKEGIEVPKRGLYLRYTVKWVDWDESIVPIKVYIMDVTDTVKLSDDNSKGLNIEHNCKVEYQADSCSIDDNKDGNGCIHVEKTNFPLQTGGYVIYATGHQHTGGVGITLYGQDGRVICSSIPNYGNGTEAGNELGYIVGMSTCYPKPGSVKISDGEILTLESKYNNTKDLVGVMGHFYILVADQLPYQHFKHSTASSFFMDINNMLLDG